MDNLSQESPLEFFDRDPLLARRVFEFQRAMRLAPMLQDAALRRMYDRMGDVDSGKSVVQPFLDEQEQAVKRGFDPFRNPAVAGMLASGIDPVNVREQMRRGALTGRSRSGSQMSLDGIFPYRPIDGDGPPIQRRQIGSVAPVAQPSPPPARSPEPVFRRNAAGQVYPTAGNYGAFAGVMQQLGLPDSGLIPGQGMVRLQDILLAAARRGRGGIVPDVPIAEVQKMRERQALGMAEAQAQAQAEKARQAAEFEAAQDALKHRRELELERAKAVTRRQDHDYTSGRREHERVKREAIRDQAYYDRLRAALASESPRYQVGSVELREPQIRAEIERLNRRYGGRPEPPTWEDWSSQDDRFADGEEESIQDEGLPSSPAIQLDEEDERAIRALQGMSEERRRAIVMAYMQKNPEKGRLIAERLGYGATR